MTWTASATVPYDVAGWSKNRMWAGRSGSRGRRLTNAARNRRDGLASLLRARIPEGGVRQRFLAVSLLVVKPDHRSDAHNCLDLVMDAIETASGLDDRWFVLNGLAWSIDTSNPHLVVTITQEDGPDLYACSGGCNQLLERGAFPASAMMVHQGTCLDCEREKRARRPRVGPRKADPSRPPWS